MLNLVFFVMIVNCVYSMELKRKRFSDTLSPSHMWNLYWGEIRLFAVQFPSVRWWRSTPNTLDGLHTQWRTNTTDNSVSCREAQWLLKVFWFELLMIRRMSRHLLPFISNVPNFNTGIKTVVLAAGNSRPLSHERKYLHVLKLIINFDAVFSPQILNLPRYFTRSSWGRHPPVMLTCGSR